MEILKKNTLLKVLSLNSISVGVSFLLGVFSSKIISIFLGTSGMALMGSFRNFANMLKSIATLGINNSIIKLFVENKEDERELSVIYSTFFWIFLCISSLLAVIILIFAKSISAFLFFSNEFTIPICFFGILLPLMVINSFWLAVYNGLEKYKKIVTIQIVSNVLVFGLTAVLIWQKSILGGLISIAIGELMMVLITYLFVKKDSNHFAFDLQKIISKKHVAIIKKFSVMALLSAVLAPLTLLLIRNNIVQEYSIQKAGVWDAVNRLSSFYMMFFGSGLSLYYMPKLASIQTESEFRAELKSYFKIFVPLFSLIIISIYVAKSLIIKIAFTNEFSGINEMLIWQLLGDFFRILTLAFGFQILVKTMMKRYFVIEIVFNASYLILSILLMKTNAIEGVLQAYFYANVVCFLMVLIMFRKMFFKRQIV